jgi:uncharacterized protein RhaS with RHS repeats
MYRRNRYYDPATGQFTQPDPIGLAGGFNAYGFAEGDPVSFSDPYGLRADSITFASPQLEAKIRAAAEKSPTLEFTLWNMSWDPTVIINFGEKDLDNPGLVDDPYINEAGKTVINVWFDFAEVPPFNTNSYIAANGGATDDDVIGHEIFGHAEPLRQGWECADPSCARRHENFIRDEMGRPRRTY